MTDDATPGWCCMQGAAAAYFIDRKAAITLVSRQCAGRYRAIHASVRCSCVCVQYTNFADSFSYKTARPCVGCVLLPSSHPTPPHSTPPLSINRIKLRDDSSRSIAQEEEGEPFTSNGASSPLYCARHITAGVGTGALLQMMIFPR